MLGTLKFILAIVIIVSHTHTYLPIPGIEWFHQGVAAVIGFFIISGFITKLTLSRKYSLNNLLPFYRDRLLRIYPQYLFYLILSFIFLALTGHISLTLRALTILTNVFLLPINLDSLLPVSFFQNSYDALIPPAWYLGTELQFYLIAPLLFRLVPAQILGFLAAVFVFTLAAFGSLDTRLFGSRLLPAVLLFYLTGFLLYDIKTSQYQRKLKQGLLLTLWLAAFILIFILKKAGTINLSYNCPVLVGYLVLLPLIYLLVQKAKRTKFDDLLGNISYGMYLNHFLLIWVFEYYNLFQNQKLLLIPFLVLSSTLLGWISYLAIDKRIKSLRLTLRNKQKVIATKPAPALVK